MAIPQQMRTITEDPETEARALLDSFERWSQNPGDNWEQISSVSCSGYLTSEVRIENAPISLELLLKIRERALDCAAISYHEFDHAYEAFQEFALQAHMNLRNRRPADSVEGSLPKISE